SLGGSLPEACISDTSTLAILSPKAHLVNRSGEAESTRLTILKSWTWPVPDGLFSQALRLWETPQANDITSVHLDLPSIALSPSIPAIFITQVNAMTDLRLERESPAVAQGLGTPSPTGP